MRQSLGKCCLRKGPRAWDLGIYLLGAALYKDFAFCFVLLTLQHLYRHDYGPNCFVQNYLTFYPTSSAPALDPKGSAVIAKNSSGDNACLHDDNSHDLLITSLILYIRTCTAQFHASGYSVCNPGLVRR